MNFNFLLFPFFFPKTDFLSEVTFLFLRAFKFTPVALLYRLKNAQHLILWPFCLFKLVDTRSLETGFLRGLRYANVLVTHSGADTVRN